MNSFEKWWKDIGWPDYEKRDLAVKAYLAGMEEAAKRMNDNLYLKLSEDDWGIVYTEYQAIRKAIEDLLSVAKCPNCDGCGFTVEMRMRQVGEDEYGNAIGEPEAEQVQCQWCFEVQALKGEGR